MLYQSLTDLEERKCPEMATPSCSCLENPRDEGAWWAAVYGVAQSRTWLKRLSKQHRSFFNNTREDSAHGHHQMVNTEIRLIYSLRQKMEKLYTVSKKESRSWLWLRSWTPFAKFRLKLKKVGKTTRPFRYDLNQIPYDYTVEMTNGLKELDLIECLKNYGQRFLTLYRRQWSKPCPRKRNAKRQNGCLRRPYK